MRWHVCLFSSNGNTSPRDKDGTRVKSLVLAELQCFCRARFMLPTHRIDFVLDNAGFELYCDCVYADWLIQSGIASSIHFHGKVSGNWRRK